MTQAREISDRLTDAFNAHDGQALGALYADDSVLSDPAGEFRGPEAIVQYYEGFFTAFPDLNGRVEFQAENGDTAFIEWLGSGTNTGPMETPEGTVPATGKPMTLRGCDALTVRDGRIQSHRIYYDQMAFISQLGLGS